MEKYIIKGGHPLNGEVTISGAKNAAVAIVPATLMVDGPCIIKNVPNIVDVMLQFEILEKMGMKITRLDETTIQTEKGTMDLESPETFELMTRLRAGQIWTCPRGDARRMQFRRHSSGRPAHQGL